MTDKIIVLVTAGSLRESKKLARRLVESRLAACVNITSPVRSIYRWQGKLTEDREYLLVIKTSRGLFGALRTAILQVHTYATPEIISLPIIDGAVDYLKWLKGSLAKPAGK
ncbi:MAG: divalent-cation tolerance protein CutA [Terriglobia bacterium]